jgi:hypothetical protein
MRLSVMSPAKPRDKQMRALVVVGVMTFGRIPAYPARLPPKRPRRYRRLNSKTRAHPLWVFAKIRSGYPAPKSHPRRLGILGAAAFFASPLETIPRATIPVELAKFARLLACTASFCHGAPLRTVRQTACRVML